VPFDGARVLLYVDQSACDGLDITLTKGAGSVQGSFKLSTEPVQGTWSALDIEARSTIDPSGVGKLLQPEAAAAIAAFSFDRPPDVSLRGHFDGRPAQVAPHGGPRGLRLPGPRRGLRQGVVLPRPGRGRH
jgi:hypothetical protein